MFINEIIDEKNTQGFEEFMENFGGLEYRSRLLLTEKSC